MDRANRLVGNHKSNLVGMFVCNSDGVGNEIDDCF